MTRKHSILLACLFAAASAVSVSSVAAESPACTRESLRSLRTGEFANLLSAGRAEAAAHELAEFIDQKDCWSALVSKYSNDTLLSKEPAEDVTEYLWARSDLAVAYLKAGRPGDCLKIVGLELRQYYTNPLELLGSDALKKAFATNERLCEAKRVELFPPAPVESCDAKSLAALKAPGRPETDGDGKKFVALKVPAETGFTCIATTAKTVLRGVLNGSCETEQECRATGDESDLMKTQIGQVVGVPAGGGELVDLDFEHGGWCSEPKISVHRDTTAANATLLRVDAGLSPCGGGSGNLDVDSYFKIIDRKLEPRDRCKRAYH